jgi:hypothetical protein
MLKIYTDDPNLPYKTTKLNSKYTQMEINGLFGKWGITDYAWKWNPEQNEIFVEFKFSETIQGLEVQPVVHVNCPVVWNHKTRNAAEEPNWNISMRTMFWFIKTHLEAAYLQRSSKTVAFLPYISTGEGGEILADKIIQNMERIKNMPALPEVNPEKVIQEES